MSQVRLSDHAYVSIVDIITTQDMEVGARLPSESRLAEMFGISRAVVREALMRLASDGITEARRGSGSFVKSRPSNRLSLFVPTPELPTTLGSYEVRFVLEAEAARLAATRRTAQEMADIDDGMDRLREALAHEPFKDLPGVKLPQRTDEQPKTVCTSSIAPDRSYSENRVGGYRPGLGCRVWNCDVGGVEVMSPNQPDETDWKKQKRYYKPWVNDGFDRPAD